MDHSENDKRFYVYVHKNKDGDVIYVGSGSDRRWKRNTGRTKEHSDIFDELDKEIVIEGLTKRESLEYELELYNKYVSTGKLINKKAPSFVQELDYKYLEQHVYYDETSPSCLRWKTDRYAGMNLLCLKRKAGDVAGAKMSNGYYSFSLNKKKYLVHRVIWSIVNQQNLPTNLLIDHIDNNQSNNCATNLRAVTAAQNSRNRKDISKTSGVAWLSGNKTWVVRVTVNGQTLTTEVTPHTLFYEHKYEVAKEMAHNLALKLKNLFIESNGIFTKDIEDALTFIKEKRRSAPRFKHNNDGSVIRRRSQDSVKNVIFEQNPSCNYARWRVRWKEGGFYKYKTFGIQKLFPDLSFEEAKQRVFELAVEFIKQKELELNE